MLKYLVANATPLISYFTNWYWDEYILYRYSIFNFAWGLLGAVDMKWSGGLFVLELH
jgi:hypothetical protein